MINEESAMLDDLKARQLAAAPSRRGFITKVALSGVSAKFIMELAGHKHLVTTQRQMQVNDEMKWATIKNIS